jgi:hypothetical protein
MPLGGRGAEEKQVVAWTTRARPPRT